MSSSNQRGIRQVAEDLFNTSQNKGEPSDSTHNRRLREMGDTIVVSEGLLWELMLAFRATDEPAAAPGGKPVDDLELAMLYDVAKNAHDDVYQLLRRLVKYGTLEDPPYIFDVPPVETSEVSTFDRLEIALRTIYNATGPDGLYENRAVYLTACEGLGERPAVTPDEGKP